jgi:hypothetical protein
MDSFVVLATLPRGHALRTAPLGSLGAECRSVLCKEWRCVARWAIARTSEFRVCTAVAVPRRNRAGCRSERGI